MYLNAEQENLARGDGGEAKRFAMQILTKVGDAMGADSLVPIKSAHVLAHYSSLHEAGIEVLESFANKGGRFAVPTTVDPASIDLENWKRFGIPEDYAMNQLRLCEAYARLGGIPCWTCVQYQVCNFPKAGETVAWAESSSVVFANSIIGCRTNKITSGMDIACAITGLTPRFGMLLDQNRVPGMRFKLGFSGLSDLDFRSIGYFLGKKSGSRLPILEGLSKNVSSDELKHLGASAAAAGPVAMIHLPGITPAEGTIPEAIESIEITKSDISEVEHELNQTSEMPDLIALGVPHLSASELGLLAKKLQGRRLDPKTKMYVYTSSQSYDLATRTGIRRDIESSGARLTHSTDAEISPLKKLGFNVIMTNSAKLAEIASSEGEVKMRYSSLDSMLEEVTT